MKMIWMKNDANLRLGRTIFWETNSPTISSYGTVKLLLLIVVPVRTKVDKWRLLYNSSVVVLLDLHFKEHQALCQRLTPFGWMM